jgi:hypothetical protein
MGCARDGMRENSIPELSDVAVSSPRGIAGHCVWPVAHRAESCGS